MKETVWLILGDGSLKKKIWYLGEMDTRLMVFFYDDNTLGRLFAMKIIL